MRLLSEREVDILKWDLQAPENAQLAGKTFDVVVHLAALTRPWGPYQDFVTSNIDATEKLLKWMADRKIPRLIHISTPAIYYNGQNREGLTEDSPLPDIQKIAYAATKLEAEKIVVGSKFGIRYFILRPRAVVSPFDQTLLPRILRILEKGFFPAINGAQAKVDVTPSQSITHAIDLAMQQPDSNWNQIFNLTNDEPYSIRALVDTIGRQRKIKFRWIGVSATALQSVAFLNEKMSSIFSTKEPAMTRYSIDLVSKSQTFDISRIKKNLGYKPQISVIEALEKLDHSL
jgi:nucleoside-diphosphate-sugar epimerase